MPATVTFLGTAIPTNQVVTIQITAYDVATTYKVTVGTNVVSVVGQGGTVATTAAALQAALAASGYEEFKEITWSVVTDTITGTMKDDYKGRPFIVTSSKTGGTGTIGAATTTTAGSGPEDVAAVANYSTGALPSAGDTLVVENLQTGWKWNIAALSGIHLAKVIFRQCQGNFGLPQHNGRYWEYRPTYCLLWADSVEFDCPNCTLARIDSAANAMTLEVKGTGTSDIENLKTLLFKGTHASNIVRPNRGQVGIAMLAGEAATIATLDQAYVDSPESDSDVQVGNSGQGTVAITTVNRVGGKLRLFCGVSGTLTSKERAGPITLEGSGSYGVIEDYSGNIEMLGSGTITTLRLGETVEFNSARNELGYVVTNAVEMAKGSKFLDPMRKATWAGWKPIMCKSKDVEIDRGQSVVFTG